MFENSVGTSDTLSIIALIAKNPGFVIAIASKVNGIIFARSFDKFSLTYEVTLTAATSAEEINRTALISIPSERMRINIARVMNQKKVIMGNRIIYSAM